ncbi:hypothetical protein BAY61_18090 [Prauserella marina]|uniref:Uncharacterized protein n=1 Tax=Prauserella marina TaxID=530584 RepID=A0A222VRS4_9PSEU|nr:hypothetical protein [Prauserella marina]ASR36594.1 hypothetical protein BAY61_18090 [Prauserella marina]PWV74002.1 hypothetical protein DES30_108176 [Prauserella marina]SDD60676.1 hypothetical protein SAMN05421630_110177 [Prauserella marina]
MNTPSTTAPTPGTGALTTAVERTYAWIQQHSVLLYVLAALALACLIVLASLRRAARRRWYAGARVVTVLPPAGLNPAAAVAGARRLWWDLPGLAPPRWKRLVTGVPHLAVEYHLTAGDDLAVRLWLPGPVPTARIEAALRAAWPGALVLDHTPSSELAVTPGAGLVVTGGTVRPERPEHLPLRIPEPRDESADPVRAWEAVTGQLAEGESAVVQILARPAVGRRVRRYRRTVDRLHSGRPGRRSALVSFVSVLVRELLEIVTGSTSTTAHGTSTGAARRLDPQQTEELREIRAKKRQPQWEVALRYYAATTAHGAEAADRVRGIADSLFGAFAVLAGHNALARHRLPKPRVVVTEARRLRRGALLSAGELAALAHLPARTEALAHGHARSVPAPQHTTRRL